MEAVHQRGGVLVERRLVEIGHARSCHLGGVGAVAERVEDGEQRDPPDDAKDDRIAADALARLRNDQVLRGDGW